MKKVLAVTQEVSPALMKNAPLARMIEQQQNPYHALHIAKAYALAQPKLHMKAVPLTPAVGNPWAMIGKLK